MGYLGPRRKWYEVDDSKIGKKINEICIFNERFRVKTIKLLYLNFILNRSLVEFKANIGLPNIQVSLAP